MAFTFRIPKVIVTGVNAHKDLADLVEIAENSSAIIISDGIKVLPEVEGVIVQSLADKGLKTIEYNRVGMSVTDKVVDEIYGVAREAKADLIVSLGGRYAMHAGRLVSMLLTNGGQIADYTDAAQITEKPATFAAVATTSSSGAAISTCVCYNKESTGERICFADPKFLPEIAILDPSMSSWLSPRDIANDGMISFGHAVEALASSMATPVTDSCALEAISSLVKWVPAIYSNSNNFEFRERLMFTQQLVSMASSNVFANLICKLAGQIESMTHIPMGNSVAAMLPIIIDTFQEVVPDKMEMLSEAILRADPTLQYGSNGSTADLMRAVIMRMDMPLKLSFLGLENEHIAKLVSSLTDQAMFTNAPLVREKEAIQELLVNAL